MQGLKDCLETPCAIPKAPTAIWDDRFDFLIKTNQESIGEKVVFQASDEILDHLDETIQNVVYSRLNQPTSLEDSIDKTIPPLPPLSSWPVDTSALLTGQYLVMNALKDQQDLAGSVPSWSTQLLEKGYGDYSSMGCNRMYVASRIATTNIKDRQRTIVVAHLGGTDLNRGQPTVQTLLCELWKLASAGDGLSFLVDKIWKNLEYETEPNPITENLVSIRRHCIGILSRMLLSRADVMIYGTPGCQILISRMSSERIILSRIIGGQLELVEDENLRGCFAPKWTPVKLSFATLLGLSMGCFRSNLSPSSETEVFIRLKDPPIISDETLRGTISGAALLFESWETAQWFKITSLAHLYDSLYQHPRPERDKHTSWATSPALIPTLEDASNIEVCRYIGEGGTCQAFSATVQGRPVVIKVHDFSSSVCSNNYRFNDLRSAKKKILNDIERYLTVLKPLQGSVIPEVLGILVGRPPGNMYPTIAVIMEDVGKSIMDWTYLTDPQRLRVWENYGRIHALGIAHNSAKPKHIMKKSEDDIRIIDFDNCDTNYHTIADERSRVRNRLGGKRYISLLLAAAPFQKREREAGSSEAKEEWGDDQNYKREKVVEGAPCVSIQGFGDVVERAEKEERINDDIAKKTGTQLSTDSRLTSNVPMVPSQSSHQRSGEQPGDAAIAVDGHVEPETTPPLQNIEEHRVTTESGKEEEPKSQTPIINMEPDHLPTVGQLPSVPDPSAAKPSLTNSNSDAPMFPIETESGRLLVEEETMSMTPIAEIGIVSNDGAPNILLSGGYKGHDEMVEFELDEKPGVITTMTMESN